VQNDIKRVIAYSTCSQLGYMFFACGVSAYGAAVFHLMTHAFFKALLFLGAGSVIHAMSGEQDMRRMGGIWKHIPFTYAYMWIGSLALAGIPLFAGYYSKDMILEAAFADNSRTGYFAFVMGISAAFFTAFYSWRLLFMTFHGKPRANHHTMEHVHESPNIMLMPLLLLAGGALFSGYIGKHLFGMIDAHGKFWNGSILVLENNNTLEMAHHVPHWVPFAPLVVALSGIALAYLFYVARTDLPVALANRVRGLYRFLLNKWYVDEVYNFAFVRGAIALGRGLWRLVDTRIIDGLGPNGVAWVSARLAGATTRLQTGYVYHYAFAMILGLVAVTSWLFYMVWVG
jgi:NADH-quinone oxidoreductase subunit L